MPYLLPRQDVMQTASDVKASLSSWDGCMAKSYCKWPVLVTIIVGGIIALSILWCLFRVICCGAECACCCFRCCVGCCGSRNRKHKHLDSAPPTPYNQQYRSHGPPVYGSGPPQFATFESSGKPVHEDALPAMPSWEQASSRKVEVIEQAEAHELDKLDPNKAVSTTSLIGGGATTVPQRPIPSRAPHSNNSLPPLSPRLPPYDAGGAPPTNPYGYGPTPQQTSGYVGSNSYGGYRGAAPAPAQTGGSGGGGGYGGQYDNQAPYDTPASSIRNDHYGPYGSAEPTLPNVGPGRRMQNNNTWRNV